MQQEKNIKLDWLKIKPDELEKIVIELHKQGSSTSKIGLVLRDQYGIPKAKLLGKSISKIIKNANLHPEPEIKLIERKIKKIEDHLSKNKHDYTAKKSLQKKLWLTRKK